MIIVHVVEPFASGVAVFVRSLTETIKDDYHIIIHGERKQVMSADEVKLSFPKKNIRFIRWKSAQRSINPIKDFLAFKELYKILIRLKKNHLVDAVHLHSSKSGLLGRIACRMAGIKSVIYTPNGAPFLSDKNFVFNFVYKQLEKFANTLCGSVVCCSASELREYERIGIKASYINNGISPAATVSLEKKSFKFSTDKFRVITSGRIEDQKSPLLFNVIASYFEEFEDFEFIWAGDGDKRNQLTASNIKVTGWITSNQVSNLVSQSQIYISTSIFEGLSFGVLEALTLKKPVLLSNCVGNTDVVKQGLNGDIFKNSQDAILKVLNYYNNREMIEVMGQHSKSICDSEFDMDRNFKNYRNIYQGKKVLATKDLFLDSLIYN